jgi:hypothetical protein
MHVDGFGWVEVEDMDRCTVLIGWVEVEDRDRDGCTVCVVVA